MDSLEANIERGCKAARCLRRVSGAMCLSLSPSSSQEERWARNKLYGGEKMQTTHTHTHNHSHAHAHAHAHTHTHTPDCVLVA